MNTSNTFFSWDFSSFENSTVTVAGVTAKTAGDDWDFTSFENSTVHTANYR